MGYAFGKSMGSEAEALHGLGPLLAGGAAGGPELGATVRLEEPEGGGADTVFHDQSTTWDAMETYFECITTCSLEDGECVTRCVEELREKA